MRKVLFKRWVPQKWQHPTGEITDTRFPLNGGNVSDVKQVPGTGCYDAEFKNPGYFHCWGAESQEDDNGVVMDTIGIVENPDGIVEHVVPKNILFVNKISSQAFDRFLKRPFNEIKEANEFTLHTIIVNNQSVRFSGDGITFTDVCACAFGEDANIDIESLSCHYSYDSETGEKIAGIMRLGDKLKVIENMVFSFNYTVAGLEAIDKGKTQQP